MSLGEFAEFEERAHRIAMDIVDGPNAAKNSEPTDLENFTDQSSASTLLGGFGAPEVGTRATVDQTGDGPALLNVPKPPLDVPMDPQAAADLAMSNVHINTNGTSIGMEMPIPEPPRTDDSNTDKSRRPAARPST